MSLVCRANVRWQLHLGGFCTSAGSTTCAGRKVGFLTNVTKQYPIHRYASDLRHFSLSNVIDVFDEDYTVTTRWRSW